jgi:hypothetical protein
MTTTRRASLRRALLTTLVVAGLAAGAVAGRTTYLPDATRAVDTGFPNCRSQQVSSDLAKLLPAGTSATPEDSQMASGKQWEPGYRYSESCASTAGGGTVSVRIHSLGTTTATAYETGFASAAGLSPETAGDPQAGDAARSWPNDAVAHVTCTWEHHRGRSQGYGVEVHVTGAARGTGAAHQRLVDGLLVAAADSVRNRLEGPCDPSL